MNRINSITKNLLTSSAIAITLCTTLVMPAKGDPAPSAAQNTSQKPKVDKLLKIPDGFRPGRDDAKYGAYSSVLTPSARALQAKIENLELKAMGLAQISKSDPIQQAEAIFILEHAILRTHLEVADAPEGTLTEFEQNSMLYATTRAYETVRHHAERLFEDMVRFIDVKIPGPSGLQFRTELKDTLDSIYLPNYRSDASMTKEERAAAYTKKLADFKAAGGDIGEVKLLTPKVLAEMGEYTRVEYVVRENNEIWISEGNAGHVLLAAGGASKSAGQIVFLKNNKGQFTMLVVSNSSGNFKPDIFSAQMTADRLADTLDLSHARVVVTKGEPVSTQAVKVYSKGLGIAKDLLKERLHRLDAIELRARERSAAVFSKTNAKKPMSCQALFSNK